MVTTQGLAFWRQQDMAVHLVSVSDASCGASQWGLAGVSSWGVLHTTDPFSSLWPWEGTTLSSGHNPPLYRGIMRDIWTSVVIWDGKVPQWTKIVMHMRYRVKWFLPVVLGPPFLSWCSETLCLLSLDRKPWWRLAASGTPCAALLVDREIDYFGLKNKPKPH